MKLHLGCGDVHLDGYINIDIKLTEATDLVLDCRKPLPYRGAEEIRAYHLLEHIARTETMSTLLNWFKALKSGGKLNVEVPDINQLCKKWLESGDGVRWDLSTYGSPLITLFYGESYCTWLIHRTAFNAVRLKQVLEGVGFTDIQIKEQPDNLTINAWCRKP